MRRLVAFVVFAVLLVQPSVWALCAVHCQPEKSARQVAAAAAASGECHDDGAVTREGSGRVARLSAVMLCAPNVAQAVESWRDVEPTRPHLLSSGPALPAVVGLSDAFQPSSPASALTADRLSRGAPRGLTPTVLRI